MAVESSITVFGLSPTADPSPAPWVSLDLGWDREVGGKASRPRSLGSALQEDMDRFGHILDQVELMF